MLRFFMVSPSSESSADYGEQGKDCPADDRMRTERLNHQENPPGAVGYSSPNPNESVRDQVPKDGNEGMVVDQTPRDGELESGGRIDLWGGQGPPPEKDAELLRRGVRDYCGAVDRGEWSYIYSHLDSETQAMFTEEEWSRRNQFLADNYPGELSSVRVNVDINPGEPADVAVYRTFKSGAYNVRDTLFIYEDGAWKHRLTGKELEPFLVDLSYEEFVSYYGGT